MIIKSEIQLIAFNAAVVAFDIATDATTLTAAEQAFTNFIVAYPTSSYSGPTVYRGAQQIL